MYSNDYRYTKEHEWIKVEQNRGTVGVTHHAQEKLGDIVFVELPKVGSKFTAMESFGSVESVKAVSDLYCPASGSITEVNAALADNPGLINQDPHQGGWLVKVELDDPKAVESLLSAQAYQEFVASEESEG
jgi:glycine cleavage system H protein